MITHIDWLSFTVPVGVGEGIPLHRLGAVCHDALIQNIGSHARFLFGRDDLVPGKGRAPYSISWSRPDFGVTMFAHPQLPHALVEVTGRGCEALGKYKGAEDFLEKITPRLTRLDVACDMLTPTRPNYFVQHREEGRFKAWSEVVSESGHTIYVGSRHSDRYCRVYRYNEPHPRAALLRCEFVLKAEQARLAASTLLTEGLDSYAASLGNTFGWTHPDWQPAVHTDAEATAWRPERRQGKTVRWVYSQVLPSLLKLHSEGALDLRAFFENEILPSLDNITGTAYTGTDDPLQ